MQTFFTFLLAILAFSVLILVHEAGHCVAAKLCGVKVEEFWLGMGPTLVSKSFGGTLYCLKLFPIGGACMMEGEDPMDGGADSPHSFFRAKRWKRFLILIAGVTMNFIVGYLIMLALYCFSNPDVSFLRLAQVAGRHSLDFAQLVWRSLYELVTGSVGMDQLSGPIGVTGAMMDMATNYGLKQFAALVAFISVNLGVMNLLPIPGLDGGRILFLLIEAVRRKPMRQEIEGYINAAFMIALFAVIIYATGNDIMRIVVH